jgi:CRISPR/Cas system CMR subunit Cmr4 (Cas7 group RAMP superfamily)
MISKSSRPVRNGISRPTDPGLKEALPSPGALFFRDAKILIFPNASALMFVLDSPPTLSNPFREWVGER